MMSPLCTHPYVVQLSLTRNLGLGPTYSLSCSFVGLTYLLASLSRVLRWTEYLLARNLVCLYCDLSLPPLLRPVHQGLNRDEAAGVLPELVLLMPVVSA